ncbi:MAG TPA: hypothetical protein VH166_10380 [Mycobacterium sp.]|jgi:hypothetical protein|nr:hypothetical protein [Mycobacterium sp.]
MSHAPDVNGHTVAQRIGYTRISTVSQTLDQQNDALEAAGATKMFSDKGDTVVADLFDDDLDSVADSLDAAIKSAADRLRTMPAQRASDLEF